MIQINFVNSFFHLRQNQLAIFVCVYLWLTHINPYLLIIYDQLHLIQIYRNWKVFFFNMFLMFQIRFFFWKIRVLVFLVEWVRFVLLGRLNRLVLFVSGEFIYFHFMGIFLEEFCYYFCLFELCWFVLFLGDYFILFFIIIFVLCSR